MVKRQTIEQSSVLEEFIGYNLKRAYVVIQSDFRATLGRDGLGPRGFAALSLVVQFPNITQSDLARKLKIERSGLVSIIDDLEKRGYLKRTTVPNDRRVQALVPTDEGIKTYETAFNAVREHEKRMLSALSDSEIQQLVALLQKIRVQGEIE